jgi:hypothetical protein
MLLVSSGWSKGWTRKGIAVLRPIRKQSDAAILLGNDHTEQA